MSASSTVSLVQVTGSNLTYAYIGVTGALFESQARDYGSVGQKTPFGANPYISIAAL